MGSLAEGATTSAATTPTPSFGVVVDTEAVAAFTGMVAFGSIGCTAATVAADRVAEEEDEEGAVSFGFRGSRAGHSP